MMVMGRRTRYIVLGITLLVIGIGVVFLTLKYGTSSFDKWHSQKMALPEFKSKPCVFPLQLPTILGVTSNLVTGKPGVIKVVVQSEYPIRGYWEERQGYTIGGRSSVSYLIPATRQRGYSSKLHLAGNGKYTVILRMRRTPARNGTDNFSLHLIQRTPCNTVIMNFDPLELINTTITLPKIINAPLPTYAVNGGKFSLKFVAKLRNKTKKSETFRNIFGGTFVRVSWTEGEHIRSVHSRTKDTVLDGVSTSSEVKTNKNARFVTVRSQIKFKNVNHNNTGLFAVGFILYTSRFVAIKTEVYTDIQAGACPKQPPAIRVESCSDMMSPRIERTKSDEVQELAAVENISNCIRVMTSGNPQPNMSLYALRGEDYNESAVIMKPATSGRPVSGTYTVKTFQVNNPKLDKPEYYLVEAKNDVGTSSFTLRIVLYRPVKLLEFYIEGVTRPVGDMAERTSLWYDVPPQTTATLTCRAIGHPLPTIRFFHIPMTTNQTDSVFVLDPVIGDPTWTNLQAINDTVIQTQIDNSTDLVTSSVTLKSGFFIGKTDYIVGCLAENRFFLNRRKIGFHVVSSR